MFTLLWPNSPLLANTLGRLDASGSTTCRWNVIPGLPQPPAKGFRLHHSYVVLGSSPFDFVSNAVPLEP
ncbi:MAG: hypothetical protein ACE5F1_09845, partial [Planctomycetota bacterium]